MRMGVAQRVMPMPMRVRLGDRAGVGVPMMRIMHMAVFMGQRAMFVFVNMSLSQMQL